MSVERIDPEQLAAFLDGRLERTEQERIIRAIAENPEEYELFADAAKIKAELARDAGVPIIPLGRVKRNRWLMAVPVALAAGLAAVALWTRNGSEGELSPVVLAAGFKVVDVPGDGSLAGRLGAAWDQPGWSVTRGSGGAVVEHPRAFRLGVRATDVELAIQAQDSAALRPVAGELTSLVSDVDGGATVAALYRRILEHGVAVPLPEREAAAAALRALLDESPWFDLGLWVEAARVAMSAGQDAFVRENRRAVPGVIERLMARPAAESHEIVALLREIDAALGDGENDRVRERLSRIMVVAGQ